MTNGWPMVPLSAVAKPISRPIPVRAGEKYRTLGVKWWGEGAYERNTIDGADTAAKTLSLIKKDDLIINKIWVRHGSVAVVHDDIEGCAGSGEFPTFELDRAKVLPRWLHWISKTRAFWSECDALSRGTSGKNRIRPELFLTIAIPLPPPPEQRRIVAKIDELAAKIEEARGLQHQISTRCDALCRAVLADATVTANTPMRDLVALRETDVEVSASEVYQFAGVYCFGRGVFVGEKRSGLDFAYKRLTRLRTEDFVYPKLMAWEGALATVPPECDGLVVSPEFPVFAIDRSRVLPDVLDVYFRTPQVWPLLSGASTGTNVRRRRLNPRDFLNFSFPLPPMRVQERMRDVKAKVDRLKDLQAKTAAELDALLPSILDKAFKGEL